MKCRWSFGKTFLAVLSLLMVAPLGAQAIAIWPSMPGSWAGYAQSSLLPAVQLPAVQLEIGSQSRGRFAGALLLPAVQLPAVQLPAIRFLCDGSVQPSPTRPPNPNYPPNPCNVVNVSGVSTDGAFILAMHGNTRTMGDGSVRIAALQYDVCDRAGNLADEGYLLLLQRSGGLSWMQPGPSQVGGEWSGGYTVDKGTPGGGDIQLGLAQRRAADGAPTAAFGGTGSFLGVSLPAVQDSPFDVLLDIQGTIGLPAVQVPGSDLLASPMLMVGRQSGPQQDQPGVIAILIGLLIPGGDPASIQPGPPSIQGTYALYGSLAAVYRGSWRGGDTFLGAGSFAVANESRPLKFVAPADGA